MIDIEPTSKPIVILTAGGLNPAVMINHLAKYFDRLIVIQEEPESKAEILKRRARHVGWISAVGQLATMAVSKLGKRLADKRSKEIIEHYGLSSSIPAKVDVLHVKSANSEEAVSLCKSLQPAVIFTISCRILKKSTLLQISCPIINFHAGINPAYRGQMGGYWSLVERDAANFGSTVHLVDSGVDTGATLYEQRLKPSRRDNISTYPLLITAVSTQITVQAIEDALSGSLSPKTPKASASKLRFPPAIWTWIWHGVTKGIW